MVDMTIMLIMVTIIMHISRIYVVPILLLMQNGIINIMLASIHSNTYLEVLVIIQRIELVCIQDVVLVRNGKHY